MANFTYKDELYHFGILGMKWGIRRYQNRDGTLTEEGKKRLKAYKIGDNRNKTNTKIITNLSKKLSPTAKKLVSADLVYKDARRDYYHLDERKLQKDADEYIKTLSKKEKRSIEKRYTNGLKGYRRHLVVNPSGMLFEKTIVGKALRSRVDDLSRQLTKEGQDLVKDLLGEENIIAGYAVSSKAEWDELNRQLEVKK